HHYRCPENVAEFELAGRLRDDPGYFCFGPETICYGRSSSASSSELSTGPLDDALAGVTANAGTEPLLRAAPVPAGFDSEAHSEGLPQRLERHSVPTVASRSNSRTVSRAA